MKPARLALATPWQEKRAAAAYAMGGQIATHLLEAAAEHRGPNVRLAWARCPLCQADVRGDAVPDHLEKRCWGRPRAE